MGRTRLTVEAETTLSILEMPHATPVTRLRSLLAERGVVIAITI
jgi:hypothetical protein